MVEKNIWFHICIYEQSQKFYNKRPRKYSQVKSKSANKEIISALEYFLQKKK